MSTLKFLGILKIYSYEASVIVNYLVEGTPYMLSVNVIVVHRKIKIKNKARSITAKILQYFSLAGEKYFA
jgi:hypothetical protein